MPIEKLDGTTGDYHPHRIGDKVNEIIDWINNHDTQTLPRFKKELLELFENDEDIREKINEVWKELKNDK